MLEFTNQTLQTYQEADRATKSKAKNMTDLERAKSMLPNMPEEVFNMFMAPLLDGESWPFQDQYDIAGLPWSIWLGTEHLIEFVSLQWKRNTLFLNENTLHPSSHSDIIALISYIVKPDWAPVGWDFATAKIRLDSHKAIIGRTNRLCAPVVLTHTPAGFRILDGHHRMAALFSLRLHHQIAVDAWIGSY